MHRVGNGYFHVNVNCIRLKQPYFDPRTAVLSSSLAHYLRPEHFQLLREFGLQL